MPLVGFAATQVFTIAIPSSPAYVKVPLTNLQVQ